MSDRHHHDHSCCGIFTNKEVGLGLNYVTATPANTTPPAKTDATANRQRVRSNVPGRIPFQLRSASQPLAFKIILSKIVFYSLMVNALTIFSIIESGESVSFAPAIVHSRLQSSSSVMAEGGKLGASH